MKKKVQQLDSSYLKKSPLWCLGRLLFPRLDVLFLCQHCFFCFENLLPHVYILPHPTFIDNNSICSHYFSLLGYQPVYIVFACKIGTSGSSAGILFTTSVSHFQVKWIPKRAIEENARYEGLMIRVFFLWLLHFNWPSFCMNGHRSLNNNVNIFLSLLEISTNICHFHCHIKLASSCHPMTD